MSPIEYAFLRDLAASLRRIFDALIEEGFTEDQALNLVGHLLKGAQQ